MKNVFISYVRENYDDVIRLSRVLQAAGIRVWLDKQSIRPGERWSDAIRQAISEGSFFIACFSNEFNARDRKFMNEELTLAIDGIRKRPVNRIWFIPVLLSDCEIPDRAIGDGETLKSLEWVDLYSNWESGTKKIISMISNNSSDEVTSAAANVSPPPRQALKLHLRLDIATRAAAAAGEEIRKSYGEGVETWEKQSKVLSTIVARHAEDAIIRIIRSEDSYSKILSGETRNQTKRADRMWIVDPLDGTRAFIDQANRDLPSVLIAYLEHDTVVCGVMYFPLIGTWYYAARGRGAWCGEQRLISDNSILELRDAWVDMNQYADSSAETPQFARLRDRLRERTGARRVTLSPSHSGIAATILRGGLAAVIHDNNPEVNHVKQFAWDVAVPRLIIEEFGGAVVNFNGERYDMFRPEPFIVARTPRIAQEIVALGAATTSGIVPNPNGDTKARRFHLLRKTGVLGY